jgi:hypothetical protein
VVVATIETARYGNLKLKNNEEQQRQRKSANQTTTIIAPELYGVEQF